MGTIVDAVAAAWRDYITDGVPASGAHEPEKSELRALGPIIESAIAQAALGALVDVAYPTRAALDADLAHAAASVALVYADSTDANNDLYVKSGASGSGSWTLTTILHDTFATFVSDAQAAVDAAEAAAAAAEAAAADIQSQIGDLRVVPMGHSVFSSALVSGNGKALGYIIRATGRLRLALDPETDYDTSGLLAGVSFVDLALPRPGDFLLPVISANGKGLGGWRKDGTFQADISSRSRLPAALVLAAVSDSLQASKAGVPAARLYFSGDSLLAGSGGGGTTTPGTASTDLGLPFVNSSVGGTTSESIGVRQGGIPMLLTLTGNELPATTAEVVVTAYDHEFTNNQSAQTWAGSILDDAGASIAVTLTRYAVGGSPATTDYYTLKRNAAAAAASTIPAGSRFIANLFDGNELDYHYIKAGRNDTKTTRANRLVVRDNILRMIDRVGHDRFGVLPVFNGGAAEGDGTAAYEQIMDCNRLILEAVGAQHWCDSRSYLASADALADAGLTASAQDLLDIAADGVPVSLRSDGIHGNSYYYALEGAFLARWHRGRGWYSEQ